MSGPTSTSRALGSVMLCETPGLAFGDPVAGGFRVNNLSPYDKVVTVGRVTVRVPPYTIATVEAVTTPPAEG